MARTKQSCWHPRGCRCSGCAGHAEYASQECSRQAQRKLNEARAESALWKKPAFKHCPLLQRILQTEPDIAILVGESRPRIESHSWFLQGLSPRLFKDLIAENFRAPRNGEPPFELDLTQAAVALPDGVSEMLGTAIAFYLRYNDKDVLEPLKQPENLEDFEGRFVPNALKLMTCGEFLGMGETPQEQGEGRAQGQAGGRIDDDEGDNDDDDEDVEDDDDDEEDAEEDVKEEEDDTLELVRHVQHAVLKEMKKAWKWMCVRSNGGIITEDPAGSSSKTRLQKQLDIKNTSYFEAALALLRASQACPQHCDAMAKLEKEVTAELSIMIGALVHPCLALWKLMGTDCSQEPWKALLDTTVKRLATPVHEGKASELATYVSTAEELARAVELLVEAEKPVGFRGYGCLITEVLLKYASTHKEELEELSVRSPSSYRVFKDHLDVDKLSTELLDEYREALIVLEPAKLAEAQGRRLQLLKGHVEFVKEGSDDETQLSVHNPYKDKCKEMTTHRYKIPDSMLAEPYFACCEFIFLSNCLWELRVSPCRREDNCIELSVEIRPARPNKGNRDNTTNCLKYPSRLKYRLSCGAVVVESWVYVPDVPDKGPIGWALLTAADHPIRMRPSELRGNTITLNDRETGKRKRRDSSMH